MTNEGQCFEHRTSFQLVHLLLAAVEASGRARCEIAADARINKDALRRILQAQRSATLDEVLRILEASGVNPRAHVLLLLIAGEDRAIDWLQSGLAQFFEDFSTEFPKALEKLLGDRIGDINPRWARGTANRTARLLTDHIAELDRKDALLRDFDIGDASGGKEIGE